MGIPRCARCGINSYNGDVTITVRQSGGTTTETRGWTLCNYCLPIVNDKLTGFIEANLEPEEATNG